jgi:DNA-3-methyladenine glycosylase
MPILTQEFYKREDTIQIAKDLLGMHLVTNFNNKMTVGRIVETEAYKAPEDKACHAYNNRRTKRTETMFLAGGVVYIYLCYGIHHLFNVVTGPENEAHAVLIRAIEPVVGINIMLERRKMDRVKPQLSAGPGVMSMAMGLNRSMDTTSLLGHDFIWIEGMKNRLTEDEIVCSQRIGVDYAEECAAWPWRFYIKNNMWVSKTRKKQGETTHYYSLSHYLFLL